MDGVLTAFFGDNYAFEDRTGSPDGRNPRNFKSFHEAAEEAGISRLYGGIHFRAAIVDGLDAGAVHRRIHQRTQDEEMIMRLASFGLCRRARLCRRRRRACRGEFADRPELRRGDGERRHRQRLFDGEWEYMVGGGVAVFDCNGDGFPDMLLPGGEKPAKFYRNTSTRGGALTFDGRAKRPRAGQGQRRLSARCRQRRHHRHRAPARRRERRDARPRRLQVRARQRGLGLRRRRCLVDGARRDLGARRRLADHRGRQLHRPRGGDFALGLVHRQLAAPPRRRRAQVRPAGRR